MWSITLDYIYGLSSGIGLWLTIEMVRILHTYCQKPSSPDANAINQIMTTLEIHQQFIEELHHHQRRQMHSPTAPIEPGFGI